MCHHPETMFSKDSHNPPWSQIIFSGCPFPLTSQQHLHGLSVPPLFPQVQISNHALLSSAWRQLTASSFPSVPDSQSLPSLPGNSGTQHLLRPLLCDRHWDYFLTSDCIFLLGLSLVYRQPNSLLLTSLPVLLLTHKFLSVVFWCSQIRNLDTITFHFSFSSLLYSRCTSSPTRLPETLRAWETD